LVQRRSWQGVAPLLVGRTLLHACSIILCCVPAAAYFVACLQHRTLLRACSISDSEPEPKRESLLCGTTLGYLVCEHALLLAAAVTLSQKGRLMASFVASAVQSLQGRNSKWATRCLCGACPWMSRKSSCRPRWRRMDVSKHAGVCVCVKGKVGCRPFLISKCGPFKGSARESMSQICRCVRRLGGLDVTKLSSSSTHDVELVTAVPHILPLAYPSAPCTHLLLLRSQPPQAGYRQGLLKAEGHSLCRIQNSRRRPKGS